MPSKYPEHEKLQATMTLSEFTQRVGEWLDENNLAVCELLCKSCHRPPRTHPDSPHRPDENSEWVRVPISGGLNGLLAEMFDVDLDHMEAEKRAMLAEIRDERPKGQPEPGAWWCPQHEAWH